MKEVKAVWTGNTSDDLKQIKPYTRPLPWWLVLAVALLVVIAFDSAYLLFKAISVLVAILCIYDEIRGYYLDVRIDFLPNSKDLRIKKMKIFRGNQVDPYSTVCEWRLLIPLSGWSRTAQCLQWTDVENGETEFDLYEFIIKRVNVTPYGARFIVKAGDNTVSYTIDDLIMILEKRPRGLVRGHTFYIGSILSTILSRES
ncbi:MAG: hypothetical protein KBC02_02570 [Candidatus Pacebacteria bacterium]|nr:hypothetical protein [Candidatus Paceibacterota bacterium]